MKTKKLMFGIVLIAAFLMVLPMNAFASVQPPASFYLIDNPNDPPPNGDNLVDLDIFNINVSTLDYSFDGSSWFNYAGGAFSVDTAKLIYFRANGTDTNGDLTFQSPQGNYYGLQAYRSLIIDWGGAQTTVSFSTPENQDFLAPVPIPAAAWLFGAGLFGLVGIRRKLQS
jgi:hypothetical protein